MFVCLFVMIHNLRSVDSSIPETAGVNDNEDNDFYDDGYEEKAGTSI
jgi:hypothetical protein